MSKPPSELNFSHVGFYVNDIEGMADFYKRILGMQETDRGEARGSKIIFLSRNPREHHQIVLSEGRVGGPETKIINQIALRAGSLQDLRDVLTMIEDEPAVTNIDPTNHGTAWSLYFRDPEGHRIEIFIDTPWYVDQPLIEPLDLSLTDEEIHEVTLQAYKNGNKFQSADKWSSGFKKNLEDAGIKLQ